MSSSIHAEYIWYIQSSFPVHLPIILTSIVVFDQDNDLVWLAPSADCGSRPVTVSSTSIDSAFGECPPVKLKTVEKLKNKVDEWVAGKHAIAYPEYSTLIANLVAQKAYVERQRKELGPVAELLLGVTL